MVVIITPLVLLASYTFAYEILLFKSEVTRMEVLNQNQIMCDGCAEYKDNLKQVKLKDIPQQVLLCEECQLKFKEVNND